MDENKTEAELLTELAEAQSADQVLLVEMKFGVLDRRQQQ